MALAVSETPVSASGKFVYNRRFIILITFIASLGGLLFGFDTAIISGTIQFFSDHYQLNELSVGWAVGCVSIGAAIGALVSGALSDKIGRKRLLLLAALLFAITGVSTGWAGSFTMFIISRVLSGVAIGAAAVVCPVYIAEISPASLRGLLVAFYQLAITLGVLLAYLSNYLLLDAGPDNWRWMFSSQSVPAILFFLGLFLVSESPRWLIRKNRKKEASQILEKVGGSDFANAEINAIQMGISHEIHEDVHSVFTKKSFRIIIIGVLIAAFSQIGGPLVTYTPEIFKEIGMTESSAFLQSVILGFILFIFTVVAITTIETVGRKKLLLYGAALLSLSAFATAWTIFFQFSAYWVLTFAMGFIAVYAATIGPVTWVVLSEIFPNRIRGTAMSIANLSLWASNFLILGLFPVMKSYFGLPVTFGIYAALCLIYFIFIFLKIPETKGKSLEEIELVFTKKIDASLNK